MAGEPRGFRLDESVAPSGRLHRSALGQDFRPSLASNFQEFERELPIPIERRRHQLVEPLPGHTARRHIVHQPGEIIGKGYGRDRIVGDERRITGLIGRDAARPFQHQLSEEHPSLEPAQRQRQLERRWRERATRNLRERNLVLVNVAESNDTRQDRRAAFDHVKENIARQPARAPGRQIEGCARERERIVCCRKPGHQLPIEQGAQQRRQKRRRGWNGEDVGTRDHERARGECHRDA